MADLSKFIEEDKDFDSSKLNQEAYKANQYEVKQYGMVESFSNVVTFYNKDLFDKAKVNYPTADWTWEEELAGASTKEAVIYTNPENKEINMIFTFEHMGLDSAPTEKWDLKPLDLIDLKENLTKWQIKLHGTGWNSLYRNNHDKPRIVSRFGDDSKVPRGICQNACDGDRTPDLNAARGNPSGKLC